MLAGRVITDLIPFWIAYPGMIFMFQNKVFEFSMNQFWHWALLAFVVDFAYYWFHRASHRIRWFWCTHSVHHSSKQLNFAANYRLGWTARFNLSFIFFSPIAILGFPPGLISLMFALNLICQFWIHAEWIPKLGFLEYIINTPSSHRVHHAANKEYLNMNYGGLLIIFDRFFGTYTAELDELLPQYGWVEPLQTENPIVIQLHPWKNLWKDLCAAKNVKTVFKTMYGPP